jgi:hypothetical protein
VKRTLKILTELYGGAARERQPLGCISNGDVEESCDSDAEESIDGDETTMKGELTSEGHPPDSHKCPGRSVSSDGTY